MRGVLHIMKREMHKILVRVAFLVAGLALALSTRALAQDRSWAAEVHVGYAGFVDDSTKNYWLFGGGLRRYVTPRISVGPELVVMANDGLIRDRNVLLTGNVVFDAVSAGAQLTPFLVAGAGLFWGRDQVRNGPYWSSDPAFTAGGGVRARITHGWSAAAEYRIGSELHQRISGTIGVHW